MATKNATTAAPVIKTILNSGTNLVEIGHPIAVLLSNIAEKEEDDDSNGAVLQAFARGERSRMENEVEIQNRGDGSYLVQFAPPLPDNYTLEILYQDSHIPGSPFRIKVVKREVLFSDHITSEKQSCVKIGEVVNFIVPMEGPTKEVNASVESVLGECNSSFNTEFDGFVSVQFTPSTTGDFLVYIAVDHVDISESPYKVTIIEPNERKCFIHEEDLPIFSKTLSFNRSAVKFRVVTKDAGEGSLNVVSRGPGEAKVKLYSNKDGSETCEFTPSISGKYYLDIMWNDEHIPGSPYQLQFKRRKTRIVSNGLNLHQEWFRIGVPHRFKLDCSEAGDEKLNVTCTPASAAKISLSPSSKANAYICEIVPQEEGYHQIQIHYGKKHIAGSPFDVHFTPPGDASKCFMVESSTEHEVGGKIGFLISTEGAGEGKLTASIENVTTRKSMPVAVTESHLDHHYKVEFNPGQEMKCLLAVMYDNQHIKGSPFQLMFSEPAKCLAEGEGIISAQAGTRNKFRVNTEKAGPGDLTVKIKRASGEERLKPTISKLRETQFEVSYLPTTPGNYIISVQWGKHDILGSPFKVRCYSTTFALQSKPKKDVYVDEQVEVKVQPLDGAPEEGDLTIEATSNQETQKCTPGQVKKDGDRNYVCTLVLTEPGRYTVSINWNGVPIQGSPFRLKVASLPKPENVKAYGPGLVDGCVGHAGKFAIDTAEAGTGLLAVRVNGPKGAFKIKTNRHPEHERTLMVQYDPKYPGIYKIEVLWSDVHIPGSPFTVSIVDLGLGKLVEEEGKVEEISMEDGEKEESRGEETKEGKKRTDKYIEKEDRDREGETVDGKEGEKESGQSQRDEDVEDQPVNGVGIKEGEEEWDTGKNMTEEKGGETSNEEEPEIESKKNTNSR